MKMAFDSVKDEPTKKLAQILFALLIVITIALNLLAPIFALNWAKQPFLGFFFYPTLIISDTYNPVWTVNPETLQMTDILYSLEGEPVTSGRDILLQLRHHQIGDLVQLQLKPEAADDRLKEIKVTLQPFPTTDFLIFFWLPYITGLIYIGAGFLIYRQRGFDSLSGTFMSLCLLVSIFLAGLFDQHTAHLLTPVWVTALPFIGASFLHLMLVFPQESRFLRRNVNLGWWVYFIAVLLGLAHLYSIYGLASPNLTLTTWFLNLSFIILCGLIFLIHLLNCYLSTVSPIIRQRAIITFWGTVISFGPAAVWAVANLLGIQNIFSWYIFGVIFILLIMFPLTIVYTTLRYRLLDLDLIFSRTAIYTVLTLLVSIAYISIASFLSIVLQDRQVFRDPILLIALVITLVIVLGAVKERLQQYVNERFLRISTDYRHMLQRYGQQLISASLNVDSILEMFVKQADKALAAEPMIVFLRNPVVEAFTIRYQQQENEVPVEVRFGLSDDLAQWLADTNDILQLSPSGILASQARIHQEELARLNMLHIILCVPLVGSKHLLGWLALGLKKSSRPYTHDDLMFLATIASQTTIALENAQLLEQANRRAAELEALQQISLDVQSQVKPDDLLPSVVEQASKLLHVEGGLVWLLEPDGETLRVVVSHDLDQDYTDTILKKGEGVAGRVILLGEPVAVDNYQTFSGRAEVFQEATYGAVLGIPLRWGGQVRGVLTLVHRPGGLRFNEDDIWLMSLFASQAAIALEKSQLLQEAQRRANQLTLLSEVSMTISATLKLETVLPQVMESALKILSAEAGSLFLMTPNGNELTFEVVLGPTGSELVGAKVPVGVGIVGTVAQNREALIINNVANDPRWHTGFDRETKFRTRNILCVPMLAHDRVVGVIEVINKKNDVIFVEDDKTLLMSFAVQAAIVIENAQIFTRTDQALAERVQELQTLQMFDQELQRSLELDTVIDITLTRAMDALGVTIGLMGIFKEKDDSGLYLMAQYGMVPDMQRYRTDPWPITNGIIGRAARTAKIQLVNDVSEDSDYLRKSRLTCSMLVIPVMRGDKLIGIIDLESTRTNYFIEDDVAFVQLLANHASMAIANAQLFEQVREANEAKSHFMNTASHDLKVPMTSIKGYAKMLNLGAAGPLNDNQREFVEIINNNVERMSRLVSDLLDVSRIEAGKIRLEIEDIKIEEIIDDVLRSVNNEIKNRHLDLTVDIEENLPTLRADYQRLVQITTNLVSNAYKYTPDGGEVTIRAKTTPLANGEPGVAVIVKDTGFGISEADQAQLFTNFFRSSDQNIRDQPGTGLGLSITKKMIESHGGMLKVRSRLNEGSTFTFILPVVSKIPSGVEVTEM